MITSFATLGRNAVAGVVSLFLAVAFVAAATAPAVAPTGITQVTTLSA